jgi:hypothetical protein
MANYPNSPNYRGQVTPGVVLEFTTGDPTAGKAVAGTPVSLLNPLPVVVTTGGGALTNVNLTQVNGVPVTLGQAVAAASIPVVLASDVSLTMSGNVVASGSVGLLPPTSGGELVSRTIWPGNTTAVVVKSSAGQILAVRCMTNAAVIGYLKLYNAASATVGVGTPQDTIEIPAPAGGGGGGIYEYHMYGANYPAGITMILTTGITDADTTVPAPNTFIITVFYK